MHLRIIILAATIFLCTSCVTTEPDKQPSWKDLLEVDIDRPFAALHIDERIETPDETWATKLISFQKEIPKTSSSKELPIFLEVGLANTVVPGWESKRILGASLRKIPALTCLKFLKILWRIDYKITNDFILLNKENAAKTSVRSLAELLETPLRLPFLNKEDETLAHKFVGFQNEISQKTHGKTVPIYFDPRMAMMVVPGEKPKDYKGPREMKEPIMEAPLSLMVKYYCQVTGCKFEVLDEGVVIYLPNK
jgi:hypothetical protein